MKIRRWTQEAKDCYKRGCVCKGCVNNNLESQKCKLKYAVIESVRQLGRPLDVVMTIIKD